MIDIRNGKTIFLTGGSGFLGQYLIQKFVEDGYVVKAMSRSTQSSRTISEAGGVPVLCNLFDLDSLREHMNGCDIVVHCAAKLETNANSLKELYKDNVEGTENIFNVSKLMESVKVFIFISTEGVIMNGMDINDADETVPRPELKELGWYNRSKVLSEEYIINNLTEQMKSVIIRLPLVWGTKDNVLDFITNLARTMRWFWIGGGQNYLSIVHAENAAHGISLAIDKADNGDIFFLSDGKSVQYRRFFTDRFQAKGIAKWKLQMSLPIWLAWIVVGLMSIFWKIFRLKGLPLLTKTGLIYSSKNFTISDEKARLKLGYENIIDYNEALKQIKDEYKNQQKKS